MINEGKTMIKMFLWRCCLAGGVLASLFVGSVGGRVKPSDYLRQELEYQLEVQTRYPGTHQAYNALARMALGVIDSGMPDYEIAAQTAFDELFRDYADQPGLLNLARRGGDRFRRRGNYGSAEQLYRRAIEQAPASKEALKCQMSLVILYIETGQTARAEAELEVLVRDFKSGSIFPRAIEAIARKYDNLGQKEQARTVYTRVADAYPASDIALQILKKMTVFCRDYGDNEAWGAAVDRLREEFPGNEEVARHLLGLAQVSYRQKDFDMVEQLCRYAGADDPVGELALRAQELLISLLVETDQQDKARAEAARLVSDFGGRDKFFAAAETVAEKFAQAGALSESVGIYQGIVDAYPGSEPAFWALEKLSAKYGQTQDTEALEGVIDKLTNDYHEHADLSKAVCGALAELAGVHIAAGNSEQLQVVEDRLARDYAGQEELASAAGKIADKYRQRKEYDLADKFYRVAVEQAPATPAALDGQVARVTMYIAAGNETKAQEALNKLISDFGDQGRFLSAVQTVVRTYRDLNANEKIKAVYQAVVDAHPGTDHAFDSLVRRAQFCGSIGDKAGALAAANRVLTDFAGRPGLALSVHKLLAAHWQHDHKYDLAEALFGYLIDLQTEDSVSIESLYRLTNIYMVTGQQAKLSGAVDRLFSDFAHRDNFYSWVWSTATKLANSGKGQQARALYQRFADAYPDTKGALDALSRLGALAAESDDGAAAEKAYGRLLDSFADHADLPEAIYRIARGYCRGRDYTRARQVYHELMAHHPDSPYAARTSLGCLQGSLGEAIESGSAAAVEAVLDEFAADFPYSRNHLSLTAMEHFSAGRFGPVIQIFKRLHENYPGYRDAPFMIATCYERLKNYPQAIAYYEEISARQYISEYAHVVPYRLGILYRRQKNYSKALTWLQKQEQYDRELLSERALFMQGVINYHNLKDYSQATNVFQEYLRRYPQGESARVARVNLAVAVRK